MYERKISSKAYPRLTSSILINAKKNKKKNKIIKLTIKYSFKLPIN